MFQRFEYEIVRETEAGIEFVIVNTGTKPWETFVEGVYADNGEQRILMSYQVENNRIRVLVKKHEIDAIEKGIQFSILVKIFIGSRAYWCDVYWKQQGVFQFSKTDTILTVLDKNILCLAKEGQYQEETARPFSVAEIKEANGKYVFQVAVEEKELEFEKAAIAGQIRGNKKRYILSDFQPHGDKLEFEVTFEELELDSDKDSFIDFYLCYVLQNGERHYRRMGYSGTDKIFERNCEQRPYIEYFYGTKRNELSVKHAAAVFLGLQSIHQEDNRIKLVWSYPKRDGQGKLAKIVLSSKSVRNEFSCDVKIQNETADKVTAEMCIEAEKFNEGGFQAAIYRLDAVLECGEESITYPVYLKDVCLKNQIEPLFGTDFHFMTDHMIYHGMISVNKSGICMLDVQEEEYHSVIRNLVTDEKEIVIQGEMEFLKDVGRLKDVYLQDIQGNVVGTCWSAREEEGKIFYRIQVAMEQVCRFSENEYSFILVFEKGMGGLFSTFPKIDSRNRAACYPQADIQRDGSYAATVKCVYQNNKLKIKVFKRPLIWISSIQNSRQDLIFTCSCDEALGRFELKETRGVLQNTVRNQEFCAELSWKDGKLLFKMDKEQFSGIDSGNYVLQIQKEDGGIHRISIEEKEELWEKVKEAEGWNLKLSGKVQGSLKANRGKEAFIQISEKSGRFGEKKDKLKTACAKVAAKFYRKFQKEPVWLVGENLAMVAQDNGYAFFQYCIKEKNRKHVYYVTKKENPDLDKLLKDKNHIVYYDSFKHLLYHFVCEYYIVAHGIRDVMPSCFHKDMSVTKKPVIYLQHGILGMKRIGMTGEHYNNTIKRFIVSSEQEKQICIKYMNFREDQLAVTGLGRFDYLKDLSRETAQGEILVMPTWRDWIVTDRKKFVESGFYKNYRELLQNQELQDRLRKENCRLIFYPHIEIRKYYLDLFEELANDVVEIADPEKVTVAEMLRRANMLVTDYSSIVYEFARLGKPVCFFQFDKNEYLRMRGSYISFEDKLPGEVLASCEETVGKIEEYIERDFVPREMYQERLGNFFDYFDNRNCERIYESILTLKKR